MPLSAFTQIHTSNTSLAVNHQGQFPVVTLSFNLAPGMSLGDATKAIQKAEAEIGMPRQRSYRVSGNRSRISEFTFHRAVADRGRDRHRVHRARAFFMRVTFTPSRFFRRCLLQAWAQSWRCC